MIAYFGVFLVAPLTGLALVVLGAGLVLATLVALVGGGAGSLAWRGLGAALLVAIALCARVPRRAPAVVPLSRAHRWPEQVGPVAARLAAARKRGAGLVPGFVVIRPPGRAALARALGSLEPAALKGAPDARGGTRRLPGEPPVVSVRLTRGHERQIVSLSEGAPEALEAALARLGTPLLVQAVGSEDEITTVSTVDPMTGCTERFLVQPPAGAYRAHNRLLGESHPAFDFVSARPDAPLTLELISPRGSGPLLSIRPLDGVPPVATYVNGGWAAVPTVALDQVSMDAYLDRRPHEAPETAFLRRMREAFHPIGLEGPDEVLPREGRFYVRYDEARVRSHWRWALALLGATQRAGDAALCGARAATVALAWRRLSQGLGARPESLAACERGMEPPSRPAVPEDLSDPAYLADRVGGEAGIPGGAATAPSESAAVPWPPWVVPPRPPLSDERWVVRVALWAYRAALLRRTVAKERLLLENRRRARGARPTGPTLATASSAPAAAAVFHVPPVAPLYGPVAGWAPASPGIAEGPLASLETLDAATERPVLWLPDGRPAHAVVLDRVAGLIVDRAGPLTHLVLLAREAGIPTVLGGHPALPDGARVRVDGATGSVTPT